MPAIRLKVASTNMLRPDAVLPTYNPPAISSAAYWPPKQNVMP